MITRLLESDRARAILPALFPPAAIVAVWIFGLGSEPTTASGGQGAEFVEMAPSSLDVTPRPRPAKSIEHAAQTRAQQLGRRFDFASPFFDPTTLNPGANDAAIEPARLPAEVVLTSLMNTSRGAIAVINGTPYRVGDRIEDMATIQAIDIRGRAVVVATDQGQTVRLELEAPGARNSN